MASPAARAALHNPALTDFLATSNVLKFVSVELADPSYGTEEPPTRSLQTSIFFLGTMANATMHGPLFLK